MKPVIAGHTHLLGCCTLQLVVDKVKIIAGFVVVLKPVYHHPACGVAFEIGAVLDYPYRPYKVARTYLYSSLAVEFRTVVHLQSECQGIFRACTLRATFVDSPGCSLRITCHPLRILLIDGDGILRAARFGGERSDDMQFGRFGIACHTHILTHTKHIVAACHYIIYVRRIVAQIRDKAVVGFRFGSLLFSCPSAVGHPCDGKPVAVVAQQGNLFPFIGIFIRSRDIPYLIPSAYPFVATLYNKAAFTGLRLVMIIGRAIGCHIRPFGGIAYSGGKVGRRCLFTPYQSF